MILSYAKYIELMTALDEYSKGKLTKKELQLAIFNHYTALQGSLVAENAIGNKRLFYIKKQRTRYNKKESLKFIDFMNAQLKLKDK